MALPIGVCAQTKTRHVKSVCGADTETVLHVVFHCLALADKVWPALLSFMPGLGLNRDDTDKAIFFRPQPPERSSLASRQRASFRRNG